MDTLLPMSQPDRMTYQSMVSSVSRKVHSGAYSSSAVICKNTTIGLRSVRASEMIITMVMMMTMALFYAAHLS